MTGTNVFIRGTTQFRAETPATLVFEINKAAGLARNWVVPRINTFVPVMDMAGAFFVESEGEG